MTSASFSGPTLPETTGAIVKRGIEKVEELQPLDADPRSLSHFGLVLLQVLDFGLWKNNFDVFQENFRACADISIAGLPAKTAPFHFNPSK